MTEDQIEGRVDAPRGGTVHFAYAMDTPPPALPRVPWRYRLRRCLARRFEEWADRMEYRIYGPSNWDLREREREAQMARDYRSGNVPIFPTAPRVPMPISGLEPGVTCSVRLIASDHSKVEPTSISFEET